MSKGKRYSNEGQLNYKKVFAVIMAIIVIIMFIVIIKKSLTEENDIENITAIDYYALYQDNAWGIIDSKGNKVIEPMYQEMIIVINNSKDVFLCTYDVNVEKGEYKTKVVNKDNQEIYKGYADAFGLFSYGNGRNIFVIL